MYIVQLYGVNHFLQVMYSDITSYEPQTKYWNGKTKCKLYILHQNITVTYSFLSPVASPPPPPRSYQTFL